MVRLYIGLGVVEMKYILSDETIPQDQRKDINTKIEYIVNNNLPESETGITKDDIFNAYTGIGGLHGLQFSNYGNYYDYQKAKAEIEQGQFFTPYKLVEWIYNCLHISNTDLVADLTCGHGAFASCAPVEANFYGCELESKSFRVAEYLYPDAHFENTDIRFYEPKVTFDYVVGNPPYNLQFQKDNARYLSEYYYCLKAAELMKPAGIMAIIVPLSFCADDFSDGGMIKGLNEKFNFICQVELDKNTFKHLGVENYKTKVLFMQKKSECLEDVEYNTELLTNITSSEVWRKYLQPITEKRESIKQKVFLEIVRGSKEDQEWQYKVEKLLYDIKRNPKTANLYAGCCEYVQQYRTQQKPDHIKYDEWEQIKIKKTDVLKHLKSALRTQNPTKSKEGRIIKHNYSYEYMGLVEKINDAVIANNSFTLMYSDKPMLKLLNRKRREYERQNVPFDEMKLDKGIESWLNAFELSDGEETIRLNDAQKNDLNLFLQKNYSFIQWEQGSGKTLAGIAIGKYRLEQNQVKNVFVVSTAIAIKNNWVDVLEQYGIDYEVVEKLSDINPQIDGKFVLITLNMMVKYHKFIKKYVKSICQKAVLIFDESDSISNMYSKRTKAVLNAFRRLRYKTLMTGTSTRNNIAEIFSQLELLYNNSVNMLSECPEIQKRNKDGELEWIENEYYMKPYPAYRKGNQLFTASHIPDKITVFGVSQFTQDVFNADYLKHMINKTMITRTFEEITGKSLYEIKQVACRMGAEEKRLYKVALEEFYKMEYLFAKTGNSRKDAMLKILNQLLALLKVCAAPQTLREYNASIMPEKFNTVISMLADMDNERVAIGVRHIEVVRAYEKAIRQAFPGRPIFIITGNETTLKQRKKVISELKNTSNGILISTQQSLSASMNIDFVDKCIIPELHWNNSSMSQYYFRFIRYTSTRFKQVYFVTYENSIESNLLKMVLVKDKLNRFMKNQDVSDDELYDIFGIESDMLENLMYKEKTEDGYVIRWGDQEVS